MQPTSSQRTTNQTKTNNINIQDVSHATVVISIQPFSTGALLRLANPGCGCTIIVQI